MGPLVDSKEMYLRTVWELEEEGIPALRVRLAERLHVSQPSVTDTVARLEHDGLLTTTGPGRALALTPRGRAIATSVMRKHRLAELLLTEVIGVDWTEVHLEACRWEHVISDAVEERLVTLLGRPSTCPHGNPIPGLAPPDEAAAPLVPLAQAARQGVTTVTTVVRRISEELQLDPSTLADLGARGLRPGASVVLGMRGAEVEATVDGHASVLSRRVAEHVYVDAVPVAAAV